MWRTRAVISLLVEDIAGLEMVPADADRPESASLDRAIRRARLVIGIDCLALMVLFLTHNPVRPFLRWSRRWKRFSLSASSPLPSTPGSDGHSSSGIAR